MELALTIAGGKQFLTRYTATKEIVFIKFSSAQRKEQSITTCLRL